MLLGYGFYDHVGLGVPFSVCSIHLVRKTVEKPKKRKID